MPISIFFLVIIGYCDIIIKMCYYVQMNGERNEEAIISYCAVI